MSTPTDPYDSQKRVPDEGDDILAPLPEAEAAAGDSTETIDEDSDLATPLKQAEPESPTASNAPSATTATPLAESAYSPLSSVSADSAATEFLSGSARPLPSLSDGASAHTQLLPEPPFPASPNAQGAPASAVSDHSLPAATSEADSTPTVSFAQNPSAVSSPSGAHVTPTSTVSLTPATPVEDDPNDWVFAPRFGSPEEQSAGGQPTLSPTPPTVGGWTRLGVLLATVALVPVAWYLLSDASIRLSFSTDDAWNDNRMNLAAIGELAGGIATASLVWILARFSSLGTVFTGALVSIAGAVSLLLPEWTDSTFLAPLDTATDGSVGLAANIVHHLRDDLGTGHILIFGAALFLTGLVCRSSRRRGYAAANRAALDM